MTETTTTPTRPQAVPTVQVDNDRVCVTLWSFAPGAETGPHCHGLDYVVVPLTTGQLLIEMPDGTSRLVDRSAGASYAGTAGTDHNVVNPSATAPFAFVEIELR
ncbi:cupin domain-containing protein [Tistrella bauzanensis]|uniref:Cupin domain-containing protein n=1 Tax=Tistrella arctica TaxID=3133430 RepID=A0ABU9YDD4_9PROT